MSIGVLDLSGVGVLLGGIAGILTILFTIFAWVISKLSDRQTNKILEANSLAVQNLISKQITKVIAGLDPDDYYTLDLKFEDGEFLHVPMIPNKPITFLENITMTLISHTTESTILTLVCDGFGSMGKHFHEQSEEEIRVEQGFITCLKTGERYEAGDVWRIPAGEFHGVMFYNCVAIITHKPPLLRASERPVNITSMPSIFKKRHN